MCKVEEDCEIPSMTTDPRESVMKMNDRQYRKWWHEMRKCGAPIPCGLQQMIRDKIASDCRRRNLCNEPENFSQWKDNPQYFRRGPATVQEVQNDILLKEYDRMKKEPFKKGGMVKYHPDVLTDGLRSEHGLENVDDYDRWIVIAEKMVNTL